MSKAFEILSTALDEAIQDAKSETPILKRDIVSIEVKKNTSNSTAKSYSNVSDKIFDENLVARIV